MGKSHNIRQAKLRAKKKVEKAMEKVKAEAEHAEYLKRNSGPGIQYPIAPNLN